MQDFLTLETMQQNSCVIDVHSLLSYEPENSLHTRLTSGEFKSRLCFASFACNCESVARKL